MFSRVGYAASAPVKGINNLRCCLGTETVTIIIFFNHPNLNENDDIH